MDREQFDDLARLVWSRKTRRAALGTIVGAALLGHAHTPLAAGRKAKAKRQRRRKKRRNRQKARPCYSSRNCLPGQGQDTSECDFSHSTRFFQGDFHGSNLSNANFTGATLAEADFRGADLGGACLVGANLLGAVIDNSTNLKEAILCRTVMPDGSTNDTGCGQGTRCCPTPGRICRTCAGFDCITTPNTVCSIFGTPCCPGMLCAATPVGVLTSCQAPCDTDQDCVTQFGDGVKCCSGLAILCPFFPGARCCQPPGPLTC